MFDMNLNEGTDPYKRERANIQEQLTHIMNFHGPGPGEYAHAFELLRAVREEGGLDKWQFLYAQAMYEAAK